MKGARTVGWFILLVVICTAAVMVTSLLKTDWEGQYFSVRNFILIIMTYISLLLAYSLIYLILIYEGMTVVEPLGEEDSFWEVWYMTLYFSSMMLFSVGNGEVVPIGAGRGIAMSANLLGHTLPLAVVWSVFSAKRGSGS